MNLADPVILKPFLTRHGLSARKGLGQHFLCSPTVVQAIGRCVEECKGILEIGPGPGVLTSPLSEIADRMTALEIDDGMIGALQESAPKANILKLNALEANLVELLLDLPEPRAVVSNLPYYITGPLLTRIAEVRTHFSIAVLMMQKEVAQRVVAREKTSARGSLSVYLQSQYEIKTIAQAPAGAFLPPPKVDSSVLAFRPMPTGFEPAEEERFFKLVRLSFAQPRKTLANNLVAGLHITREEALKAILEVGLLETARPQELTLEAFKRLAKAFEPHSA